MSTNHNLFEEKGEPKRNRTGGPPACPKYAALQCSLHTDVSLDRPVACLGVYVYVSMRVFTPCGCYQVCGCVFKSRRPRSTSPGWMTIHSPSAHWHFHTQRNQQQAKPGRKTLSQRWANLNVHISLIYNWERYFQADSRRIRTKLIKSQICPFHYIDADAQQTRFGAYLYSSK